MVGYIYEIRNLVNNKVYIGSTINFKTRKNTHLYELKSNKHESRHLQSAYNKYGAENFKISIIKQFEIDNISELYKYENDYCVRWKTFDIEFGYNLVVPSVNGGTEEPLNSIPIYQINNNGEIVGEFKSIEDCYRNTGISQNAISNLIYGKNKTYNKYFFIKKCDYNESTDYSFDKNRKQIRSGKSVNQYTLDGKFIKTYYKIADAKLETNTNLSSIALAVSGEQKSANGFIWKRYDGNCDDLSIEELNKYGNLDHPSTTGVSKKIYQYDTEMNLIAVYESIKSASKFFNEKSIKKCLYGERKTYKGYIWSNKPNIAIIN